MSARILPLRLSPSVPAAVRRRAPSRHRSPLSRSLGRLALAMSILPSVAHAQRPGVPSLAAAGGRVVAGLHGVVLDTADRPIAGVRVQVQRQAERSVMDVTRDEGRFAIAPLTPGEYLLSVRAIGYRPADFVVTVGADVQQPNYELVLEPAPQELRSMLIVASPMRVKRLAGFAERQRHGGGHYFTAEQIMESRPSRLSDMLQTVPGLVFTPWAFNGNYRRAFSRSGGPNGVRCLMSVYLDGSRLPDGWSIDDLATLDNVAAVEIYTRWMATPPQFVHGGDDDRCGAVAVWTKDGAGVS
ncbi:MAG: carboxypeptidase-like regulatory domain-containing protein [Gemmatimonadaceae bacterium]